MTVRILYNNRFEEAPSVVASGEASGNYYKENAYDGLPRDFWKAAASGHQYLYFDMGVGNTAVFDACYLYAFDLQGGQAAIQYSDDGITWYDSIAAFTPATDVVFKSFASQARRFGRIDITGSTAAPQIAAAAIGKMLEYSRGVQIGFAPLLGQPVKGSSSTTADGYPSGSYVTYVAGEMRIFFNNLNQASVRADWMPFWEHAKLGKPFVVSWDEASYPNEAAFCRCDPGTVEPIPYSQSSRQSFELRCKAWVIK